MESLCVFIFVFKYFNIMFSILGHCYGSVAVTVTVSGFSIDVYMFTD